MVIRDLQYAGRQLLIDNPYYGLMLASLNKKISEEIGTACVYEDNLSVNLMINPNFWNQLILEEKKAILVHELLHIGFMHFSMRKNFKNKELLNIAADIEINQYITPLKNCKLPEGALSLASFNLDNPKHYKKGTKYYYELLQNNLNSNSPNQNLKDLMEKLTKKEPNVICAHEKWKEFEKLSDSTKRIIENNIKNTLKNTKENLKSEKSTIFGNLPQKIKDILNEINFRKSEINYKYYLKMFCESFSLRTYTKKVKRKDSIRFPKNPGLKIKQRKSILCAIDTSGSVSIEQFKEFMQEIDNIRKTGVNVTICECDAYIDEEKGIYQFEGLSKIKNRTITGGGGTSFNPPIEYFNKNINKYSAIIYLTDGYAPVPKINPRRRMLWVINKTGQKLEKMKEFPGWKIKMNT